MGRFFKSARAEFVPNSIYVPNFELMAKVIQNDNQMRDSANKFAEETELALLQTPHLAFDTELLQKTQESYKGEIEAITQSLYNDPDAITKLSPKISGLRRKLLLDKLNGPLGDITRRHAAYSQFQEMNKDLQEKDPMTYNLALRYELMSLAQKTAKDPKATFTPYRVIATPNIRKDIVAEIDKLKASSQKVPDGKGYFVEVKNLSPDRIIALATSNVLGRPEYAEYAKQQTLYGVGGFFNPDGTPISPYSFYDKEGNALTPKQVEELTPEQQKGLIKGVNPGWRFGKEVGEIARAFAYNQQSMSSDGTWAAKLRESGENSRFAQKMAWDKEKFRIAEENKDRRAAMKAASGSRGTGGKGDGKEGANGEMRLSKDGNDYGIYLDKTNHHFTLSEDMNNKNSNIFAKQRLKTVRDKLLADPKLKGIKIGKVNAGQFLSSLMDQGVDIFNPDSPEFKKAVYEALKKNADFTSGKSMVEVKGLLDNLRNFFKSGEFGVEEYKNTSDSPSITIGKDVYRLKNFQDDETLQGLSDITDLLRDSAREFSAPVYKDLNANQVMSHGIPLDGQLGTHIVTDMVANPNKYRAYDYDTGAEVPLTAIIENSKNQLSPYYHPNANSSFGGVTTFDVFSTSSSGKQSLKRVVVESRDFERRAETVATNAIRKFRAGTADALRVSPAAQLYDATISAGRRHFDKEDLRGLGLQLNNGVEAIVIGEDGFMRIQKNGKLSQPYDNTSISFTGLVGALAQDELKVIQAQQAKLKK